MIGGELDFICLTLKGSNLPIWISRKHIGSIETIYTSDHPQSKHACVNVQDDGYYVKETPEEILEKLK